MNVETSVAVAELVSVTTLQWSHVLMNVETDAKKDAK